LPRLFFLSPPPKRLNASQFPSPGIDERGTAG
jgi:hypothetical protein